MSSDAAPPVVAPPADSLPQVWNGFACCEYQGCKRQPYSWQSHRIPEHVLTMCQRQARQIYRSPTVHLVQFRRHQQAIILVRVQAALAAQTTQIEGPWSAPWIPRLAPIPGCRTLDAVLSQCQGELHQAKDCCTNAALKQHRRCTNAAPTQHRRCIARENKLRLNYSCRER